MVVKGELCNVIVNNENEILIYFVACRALLYGIIEDFISTFGVDGKACLLRAICEVHSRPVHGFGLLGEVLKLFFT